MPGSVNSSPVTSTATVGRRAQDRTSRPIDAATPSSAGPTIAPRRRTTSPARTSSPARRMLSPSAVASTRTRPLEPSTAPARSIGTTAVAPLGSTAPVEMRIAAPAATSPGDGRPARASSITRSSAGGPARTAKPSMAELSNGGTLVALSTSRASTRSSAWASGTSSASSGRTASSTRRRASSIEMSSATAGYSIKPWRIPMATACVRVDASSLARMRLVWVRTVSVESPSSCATASVCMPSASIWRI